MTTLEEHTDMWRGTYTCGLQESFVQISPSPRHDALKPLLLPYDDPQQEKQQKSFLSRVLHGCPGAHSRAGGCGLQEAVACGEFSLE